MILLTSLLIEAATLLELEGDDANTSVDEADVRRHAVVIIVVAATDSFILLYVSCVVFVLTARPIIHCDVCCDISVNR